MSRQAPRSKRNEIKRITLAHNLRKLRHFSGLTTREVVEKTKCCSISSLSELERGVVCNPSCMILHPLCELYGVAMDDLFVDEGWKGKLRIKPDGEWG